MITYIILISCFNVLCSAKEFVFGRYIINFGLNHFNHSKYISTLKNVEWIRKLGKWNLQHELSSMGKAHYSLKFTK